MKLEKSKYLLLLLLVYSGCKGPEELSFEVTNYLQEDINFNGLYYNQSTFEYFIFFQNGVYHTAIATEKNLQWIVDYFADSDNYEGIEDLPYFWGAYIESSINTIEMEGWLSNDGGGGYPLYSKSGSIISPTEILLDGNPFIFEPLTSKPDSVLSWIN